MDVQAPPQVFVAISLLFASRLLDLILGPLSIGRIPLRAEQSHKTIAAVVLRCPADSLLASDMIPCPRGYSFCCSIYAGQRSHGVCGPSRCALVHGDMDCTRSERICEIQCVTTEKAQADQRPTLGTSPRMLSDLRALVGLHDPSVRSAPCCPGRRRAPRCGRTNRPLARFRVLSREPRQSHFRYAEGTRASSFARPLALVGRRRPFTRRLTRISLLGGFVARSAPSVSGHGWARTVARWIGVRRLPLLRHGLARPGLS